MITVTARVRLTLDIQVSDSWGTDCDFAQIRKQAIESATNELTGPHTSQFQKNRWSIVGTPRVTAVMVSEKDEP